MADKQKEIRLQADGSAVCVELTLLRVEEEIDRVTIRVEERSVLPGTGHYGIAFQRTRIVQPRIRRREVYLCNYFRCKRSRPVWHPLALSFVVLGAMAFLAPIWPEIHNFIGGDQANRLSQIGTLFMTVGFGCLGLAPASLDPQDFRVADMIRAGEEHRCTEWRDVGASGEVMEGFPRGA